MLSEASDLTDLSSDDNGGQNTKGKAPTKRTGYRLRNVLKPGRTTQYTAKALYDQIHDNDIDLNPEYQRDVVWSEAKQVGLIDSIFRNFYVPPIIFAVTTEDDGTEKRVCIDGKQRLTSIQRFIGGLIPHRDPFTNERLWFVDSKNGPKRKLLPPQYRTLFKNKQIVCIEYSELPADLEREVFQRVQMGMALTTAEKLQSISGPWPDLVRHVNNEYYLGKDGISAHIDLDHARARDFQNISQALFCIDQLPAQSQGTTTQLEKWLSKEKPSEATCAKIYDVFRIFRDLAKHKQYKLPLKTPNRIAPAEFIMIGVMIAMFKDQMSLPQLSQAIGILRSENRAVHADIRTNSKVFKTMYHIISSQIKVSALKDTPGVPVAGNTTGATAAMPIGTSMIVSGGVKRKREEYMDVDGLGESVDDEAENQPKIAKVQQMPKDTPVNATNSHPASSNAPVTSSSTTVKIDDNGSALSPVPSASKHPQNHYPRPIPTGPASTGRFARIRAAKAQASMMANGSGSGRFSTPTSQESSIDLPHPNNQSSSSNSLEAMMTGRPSHPFYSPRLYPIPSHDVPYQQHSATQSTNTPIPIREDGSNPGGSSRTIDDDPPRSVSSGHDRNEGGNYRGGRNGYSYRGGRNGYSDRDDYRDKGKGRSRSGDRDNHAAPGSFSNRGDLYARRDSGWSDRSDRNSRDYRGGSKYDRR